MNSDELRTALSKLYGEGTDYHLVKSAVADLGCAERSLYLALDGDQVALKVPLETALRLKGVLPQG